MLKKYQFIVISVRNGTKEKMRLTLIVNLLFLFISLAMCQVRIRAMLMDFFRRFREKSRGNILGAFENFTSREKACFGWKCFYYFKLILLFFLINLKKKRLMNFLTVIYKKFDF